MLVIPAYAKLNLGLEVVARRADGLHDIESVMTAVDWHDLIGVALRPGSGEVTLRLTGPAAGGIPAGAGNLAARAARALTELAGRPVSASVWLDKHLPTRAGLGGGSADAAAVLLAGVALLAREGIAVPQPRVHRAARELGADVPALLVGGTSAVSGSGDIVERLPAIDLDVALAVAGESDTGATYGALRPAELSREGRVARLRRLLAKRQDRPADLDRLPDELPDELLGSALEAPACRASATLADSLGRLRRVVPARWHLTGSGGCAFALATSAAAAAHLAAEARAAGFASRACRAVRSAQADRFTAWP